MAHYATTLHPRATVLTWKVPELRSDHHPELEPGALELVAVHVGGREVNEREWCRALHPGEFQTLELEAISQIDWNNFGRGAAEWTATNRTG